MSRKSKYRIAHQVTPERFAEIINAEFRVLNADGTPGKCTPEIAARLMNTEAAKRLLPPLPADVIVAGLDEPLPPYRRGRKICDQPADRHED